MRFVAQALFILAISAFISWSCASKKPVESDKKPETGTALLAPDSLDKSAPKPEEDNSPKFYFSDLQILVETTPDGDCPDKEKINLQNREYYQVKVVDRKLKTANLTEFGLNINLQTIGFDNIHQNFSVIDGKAPAFVPFKLSFHRTKAGLFTIKYLDQELNIRSAQTPVYTLSAVETRGTCKINHNVNLFLEHSGRYPLE